MPIYDYCLPKLMHGINSPHFPSLLGCDYFACRLLLLLLPTCSLNMSFNVAIVAVDVLKLAVVGAMVCIITSETWGSLFALILLTITLSVTVFIALVGFGCFRVV